VTTTAHSHVPGAEGDGLTAGLLARRRRRLPLLTAVLVLALAMGAAFAAGAEAQKRWGGASGSTANGTASSDAASRFGGARAASGFTPPAGFTRGAGRSGGLGGLGGFGGTGGAGTVGTVTLIKGSTLYVTDASGNTVLVRTSPSSRVTKTVAGTIRTVHPGDTVAVSGTRAANGSYRATRIAITGAATDRG
jgi:Domain of unknown function (DUF5666)